MLEDASIKLSAAVSSLKTVSARAMLAVLIDGETDPKVLAQLAEGKLRGVVPSEPVNPSRSTFRAPAV